LQYTVALILSDIYLVHSKQNKMLEPRLKQVHYNIQKHNRLELTPKIVTTWSARIFVIQ